MFHNFQSRIGSAIKTDCLATCFALLEVVSEVQISLKKKNNWWQHEKLAGDISLR